jgi:hypothetical protein
MSPRRRYEGDPAPIYGKSHENSTKNLPQNLIFIVRVRFRPVQSYVVYLLDLLWFHTIWYIFCCRRFRGFGYGFTKSYLFCDNIALLDVDFYVDLCTLCCSLS